MADYTPLEASNVKMIAKASRAGDITRVETLLNNGAAVDAVDEFGRTALMFASSGGYDHIVKLLLDHGADANAQDRFDNTALMWACHGCHAPIVRLLLKNGANVALRNVGDTDAEGHLNESPCPDERKGEIRALLSGATE